MTDLITTPTAREEFLARRKRFIGGTDVAPILGISAYRTALDVYMTKRGLVEDREETVRMEMGRYFEEPILQWYVDTQGLEVVSRSEYITHPEYPWLGGNLDLRVRNEHRDEWVTDAKNVHFKSLAEWGDEGTDSVPVDALFQAHHYLALVPKAHKVDFAVLRGGHWPPRIYTVVRDDELFALVLPKLQAFWFDHVLAEVPPALDFADDKTLASIKTMYPPKAEKDEPVDLPPIVTVGDREVELAELTEAYDLLKKMGREVESRAARVEAALRAIVGSAKSGRIGEVVVDRVFNKGGFRPAHEVKPYDYLKLKFPKNHEFKITAARVAALLEGESNG